ncbi:MAG: class I SAM-dependent methyltransferase [Magnetococcales bacterium]|nr:class I SAM-dependent methyltransferase [Magnetococcales bacterium]
MSRQLFESVAEFPCLSQIIQSQLREWPAHAAFLEKRFAGMDPLSLARCEELSGLVLVLIEDELDRSCADYHWMCNRLSVEQVYFLRHGSYRLKTFDAVHQQLYGNDLHMARHVRGLLLSQIFWHNHAMAIELFRTAFLAEYTAGGDYLEVGPGHGLFLYFAAREGGFTSLTGWEWSRASIEATQCAVAKLSIRQPLELVQQDVLKAPTALESFDAVVISEVLEHLETPWVALETLYKSLRPRGRIFINIPINSPAPDHLYLWRHPDEVRAFVQQCGFMILREQQLPMTGYTVEQAITGHFTLSSVIIGEKRAATDLNRDNNPVAAESGQIKGA